jgi:hypothetical protein
MMVEGAKGGKEATTLAKIHKNSTKNGRFPHLLT